MKKEDIVVTPNGVSAINDTSDIIDGDFILFVSRIEPRKNHITLLKAFVETHLYERGVNLVFAGKKVASVPILEAYVNSLSNDIKKHIIFCTPTDDELEKLLNSCKFFVYPSLAEGFGIPPLEAALHRRLVLCSDATAMQEFSDLGFIMFSPMDQKELEDKMLYCCSVDLNTIDYDTIICNIKSQYNWDKSAEIVLGLFR